MLSTVFGFYTASASESGISLKLTEKTLYLNGCKGRTAEGTAAKYYSYLKVRKIVKGFDTETYDIVLKSKNSAVASVSSKKDRIYAKGIGRTEVVVKVKSKADKSLVFKGTVAVNVEQNADEASFKVEGISDTATFYEGDSVTVSMPGEYTDIRTLICEDEGITVLPEKDGKRFTVYFDEAGDYILTAAAYQSRQYNGFTAQKEFNVTVKNRKAEVIQTAADKLLFRGGPVDEDTSSEDISIFEEQNGVMVFYSYASKVEVKDDEASITLFRSLGSEKKYELRFENLSYAFSSTGCGIENVKSFKINEEQINAGEEKELTFSFYNEKGMDITAAVGAKLNDGITLEIKDPEQNFKAYLLGRKIFITEASVKVEVSASLNILMEDGSSRQLNSVSVITGIPERGEIFTGNNVYTLKPSDGKYMVWGDKCIMQVPLGDEVEFDALFEMGDGKVKNLKDAGITGLFTGDMRVAMIGEPLTSGGYRLILNNEGKTSVVALKGEEVAGTFEIEVLPERKPSALKVELTKKCLNTDMFVDDYLFIKADMYDQYDKLVEGAVFDITQDELNKNQLGEIGFNKISEGRYIVYGYECPADTAPKTVTGKVVSGDFSENFSFLIKDVPYDTGKDGYTYSLQAEGAPVLDTAVRIKSEAPKSTFVNVMISSDGYYVGEGIGYFFDKLPSVLDTSEYYGVKAGTCIYGISVEYTDENGKKVFLGSDEACVIPTYSDIEFVPYTFGEKLPSGTYTVTSYRVITGDTVSKIAKTDTMTLKVIDSDPEIEVVQTAQSYFGSGIDWNRDITEYFSFKYEGEDISKFIIKVDCVEAATGSVFVRSVDFRLIDPYFGPFIKTALIERLITKQ